MTEQSSPPGLLVGAALGAGGNSPPGPAPPATSYQEPDQAGQGTDGDVLQHVGDGLGLLVRLEEHRHLDLTGGERHDAQGVGDALGEVDRGCLSALPVVSLLEGDGLERLLPD